MSPATTANTASAIDIDSRVDAGTWSKIAAHLDAHGWAIVTKLLTAGDCRAIAGLYGDDRHFRSHIIMARHGFGRGEYKYFAYPLPPPVAALRSALYPRLAAVAHRWERALGLYQELRIQRAFIDWGRFLSFWNIYYGTIHFVFPVVTLVWMYRKAPARYVRWRNTLVAMWAIAVVVFQSWLRLLGVSRGIAFGVTVAFMATSAFLGNDFVQSLMYTRGVTCFSCHDVHGTKHDAVRWKPANAICLDCHGPNAQNGPHSATIEEHTHHKTGSTGSACIACHMPKIEQTIGDVNVRAHTFRFVSPAEAEVLKMPNACNVCHTDKT
jgi:predicted CXXCH cytochrome family protein